jgi:NhaP-type Na+/H+ or K+/H+ antiporter
MQRLWHGLISLVAGYILGGLGGMLLVHMLSSNRHDLSVEAVMTGAFVTGPAAALIGFVAGVLKR